MPIEAPFDTAFEDSNFKLALGMIINKRFGEAAAFGYWHALMKSGQEQRIKENFWHSLIIDKEEPEQYKEYLGGQSYERLKRGIIDRAVKGSPSASDEGPFSAEGAMDTSDLNLEAVAAKMKMNEATDFMPFDEAPVPIDGLDAVQKNLFYPETAIGTGMEGRVIVSVEIDIHGNVTKTTILKSMEIQKFDKAASDTVKAIKFHPAKKNGQPVKSRIIFPVVFAAK